MKRHSPQAVPFHVEDYDQQPLPEKGTAALAAFTTKGEGNATNDLDAFVPDLGFSVLRIIIDAAETDGVQVRHK